MTEKKEEFLYTGASPAAEPSLCEAMGAGLLGKKENGFDIVNNSGI